MISVKVQWCLGEAALVNDSLTCQQARLWHCQTPPLPFLRLIHVQTFKWQGVHSLFEEVLYQTPLFGPLIQHKPAVSVNHGGLRWAWKLNEGLRVFASEYWLYSSVWASRERLVIECSHVGFFLNRTVFELLMKGFDRLTIFDKCKKFCTEILFQR